MEKIEVQKSGELQPVDPDGYVINTSALDNIKTPWKEAAESLKQAYIDKFGGALHSIYLRGSVPRGKAVEEISDLDSIVVIKAEHAQSVDLSWFDEFSKAFITKYPFVSEVELRWVNYGSLLNPEKLQNVRIQLSIYGVCIYGEDIIPNLPRLKPGRDTIIHAPTIDDQVKAALKKFEQRKTSEGIKAACTWIMKAFLRTGCELVMEREQAYTRDLFPCYELFAKYYPEKKREMYQILEYALNPTDDRQEFSHFTQNFGSWLCEQVKKQGLTR